MDREDARFVAHALERRIDGARGDLEQLAASSLMRLSAIATRIDKQNDGQWVPASVASEEIMAICREGAKVADVPLDECRRAYLDQFIAKLYKLLAEPQPMNRALRRAHSAMKAKLLLPRSKRLITAGAATPGEILR